MFDLQPDPDTLDMLELLRSQGVPHTLEGGAGGVWAIVVRRAAGALVASLSDEGDDWAIGWYPGEGWDDGAIPETLRIVDSGEVPHILLTD